MAKRFTKPKEGQVTAGISFNVTEKEAREIDRAAEDACMSRSAWIRGLIRRALRRRAG